MKNRRNKLAALIFTIVFASFASGCGEPLTPEQVVRAHVDALNAEDIDAAMSHIESGPNYEITRMTNENIFKNYNIRYTVEKVETLEGGRDERKLRVTQTTVKLSGPAFVNNRMTAVWTLRSNWRGTWRIVSTEGRTIEYL